MIDKLFYKIKNNNIRRKKFTSRIGSLKSTDMPYRQAKLYQYALPAPLHPWSSKSELIYDCCGALESRGWSPIVTNLIILLYDSIYLNDKSIKLVVFAECWPIMEKSILSEGI